jgi:hypothetical protein
MWGHQYNFPRNYAYSTIVTNEKELKDSINLNLKLKRTGHFFPLVILLLENNSHFIKKIN